MNRTFKTYGLSIFLGLLLLTGRVGGAQAAGPGPATAGPACGGRPTPWLVKKAMPANLEGVAVASGANFAWAAGGYNTGIPAPTHFFARYNPIMNTWQTLPALPYPTAWATAAFVNNKLYVFGGIDLNANPSTRTQIYDPATNTWSLGAPMPGPRWQMAGAANGSRIYLVGGYSQSLMGSEEQQTWAYDTVNNLWTTALPALPAKLGGAGAAVINGNMYIAGGRDSWNTALNTLYAYSFALNTWTTLAALPVATNGPGAAAVNGRLWIFGGGTPFAGPGGAPDMMGQTQEYIPGNNLWIGGPALNVPRSFVGGTKVGDYVVAIGGNNGGNSLPFTEVSYQPLPCDGPGGASK